MEIFKPINEKKANSKVKKKSTKSKESGVKVRILHA